MQPGSPRRSWPRSPGARRPQPPSKDSCGSRGALRGLDPVAVAARSSAWNHEEGEDDGTHTVAARTASAGRRARCGRAPRGPGRRAAGPPRGARVLAEGLPQADRGRRRRAGRGRSRRGARAHRARRDGAANRDRRRRHRGPDDGSDAAGQGHRLDGLRSPSVAHRRPHALRLRRLPGLLGQRPGSRAVRRADRHGAQDDPRARQAVQPGDGRPPRRRAERLDRHVPLLRRLLPRGRGRSRLQGDPCGAAPRPVRGELSDDLQDLDGRGDRARQHEHLRVDRVPRARAATRPRSASCSTSPTTSSTEPRRPISPRSTSSTCSATPAPPSRSTASPTSASTSSAATPCFRSRSATRSRRRRAPRPCAWAGG